MTCPSELELLCGNYFALYIFNALLDIIYIKYFEIIYTHQDNEILAHFLNMVLEDRTKNENDVRNVTITIPV